MLRQAPGRRSVLGESRTVRHLRLLMRGYTRFEVTRSTTEPSCPQTGLRGPRGARHRLNVTPSTSRMPPGPLTHPELAICYTALSVRRAPLLAARTILQAFGPERLRNVVYVAETTFSQCETLAGGRVKRWWHGDRPNAGWRRASPWRKRPSHPFATPREMAELARALAYHPSPAEEPAAA